MTNTAEVVIIGGIAGLSLAVELKRRKAGQVVLIERNYIGSGASGRNVLFWRAGYLWLLYDSDEIDRMRTISQFPRSKQKAGSSLSRRVFPYP